MKERESEITPERLYLSRRQFIAAAAAVVAVTAFTSACRGQAGAPATGFCADAEASGTTDELGASLTSCNDVISYNNFYEFSLNKDDVASLAAGFRTSPWTVSVGCLVNNPGSYSVADLVAKYSPEERIYRMRCVEAWSMVIPWMGFPLASLLNDAQPQTDARFVRFEGVYDPKQLPGQKAGYLNFPYVEGLRLDEAMNSLTILATGLYGKPLPVQDGAPIRLVVPWKYGFKSIKSIVKIELVKDMPVTSWPNEAPDEYGFYANVNPNVPHPRWSQASERRIGEFSRRSTLLFNGYGAQVAQLYAGMDLTKDF
jgi:methionine sulfoxide reductase catalytic subunit